MIIVIDTIYPRTEDHFTVVCFARLAKKYPQHHFIFLSGKSAKEETPVLENTQTVLVSRPASTILWSYWYNHKLPVLLRKYKADVFVAANGICSTRTKLPQCLIIQDLSSLAEKKYSRFYTKFLSTFLNKAKTIVCFSQFSQETIIEKYKTTEQRINVVQPGINNCFNPFDETAKESFKEKYTDGKEYFLYSGGTEPQHNLLNLLKAFSFFKKRQKSNMQLLIIGTGGHHTQFTRELSSYKFREEVKFLPGLPSQEIVNITAAAYAFVYPVLLENFPSQPLEAMRADVPVICSNKPVFSEICTDAALYADPGDFNDIAANMMLVYKDEQKREQLIQAGRLKARQYDWDKSAEQLWEVISTTIEQ